MAEEGDYSEVNDSIMMAIIAARIMHEYKTIMNDRLECNTILCALYGILKALALSFNSGS